MWLRIAILLLSLGGPAQADAPSCASAYPLFAKLGQESILAKEIRINAAHIEASVKELSVAAGKAGDPNVASVLRFALENATQHGIEDMYMPELAKLKVEVLGSGATIEIRITNELHKKFPERLARTFFPGENVALEMKERPFPRGMGVGLPQIFRSFAEFPAGSQMSWIPDGSRSVTFSLRFPR